MARLGRDFCAEVGAASFSLHLPFADTLKNSFSVAAFHTFTFCVVALIDCSIDGKLLVLRVHKTDHFAL